MVFQEPVDNEDDIVKFCEETGLPVALDETINSLRENPHQFLQKYSHSGVAAVVRRTIFFLELILIQFYSLIYQGGRYRMIDKENVCQIK